MRRSAALLASRLVQQVAASSRAAQAALPALQQQGAHAAFQAAGAWSQTRWNHCSCSGDLSLPPPEKVVVEYAPEEVDAFIAFADAVEEEFAGIMVDGVEVHGRPHAFDIKLEDGRTIFERAAAPSPASLPQYSDLFDRLRQAGLQAAAA